MQFLIVGLGNIGAQFNYTRHNAGFIFIDTLLKYVNNTSFKEKFQASYCATKYNNEVDIILLRPHTYMNGSGISVQLCQKFYKIETNNIFVFYDDIEVPLGKVKIKYKGGTGGHNGIRSLNQHIGNDFYQIHIGVGRPEAFVSVHDHVLSRFKEEELALVEKVCDRIAANLGVILSKDNLQIERLVQSFK